MQRGTVRARFPSPVGIDAHPTISPESSPGSSSKVHSHKRQRVDEHTYEQPPSAATKGEATSVHTGLATRAPTSPSSRRISSTMGRESNGSRSSNGAGPSGTSNGNGHADPSAAVTSSLSELIAHVTAAEGSGGTMYPDDDDWAEHQHGSEHGGMDVDTSDTYTAGESSTHALAHKKRMPVEKEEFVRLVLQGLRDVGYE